MTRTTRDAALSRLFGSEAQPTEGRSELNDAGLEESADSDAALSAMAKVDSETPEQDPRRETVEDDARVDKASRENRPRDHPTARGTSGYIGRGRYAREDGILERITPYVRPDQAEALRVAVARKRDPRGKDISQIVQSLLDEAGYRGGVG